MLTDTALRNLKPKSKPYKVFDRDGMDVTVSPAEYAGPRRHMLQEWADMVEAWIDGRTHVPKLVPEDVSVPVLSPAL